MLDNRTRYYVVCRIAGWMVMNQAFDARESSWGRCTWQFRLVMASFGAWKLAKATGYRETKDREGLSINICMVTGSIISTRYSIFAD